MARSLIKTTISPETLHAGRCALCPLAKTWKSLRHPKMEATGASEPAVFVLGEAPGREEDEAGRQFVGQSGKILRSALARAFADAATATIVTMSRSRTCYAAGHPATAIHLT